MKTLLDALQHVMDHGVDRDDRTGTGTRSVFAYQMRFDLQEGFPAVTTKKLAFRSVLSELLWFLEGSSDERRLAEILYGKPREELTDKTTIWTANANADYWKPKARYKGDLGRVYGVQWRSWNQQVDQIADVIDSIKNDPDSRRHVVTAYNPGEIDQMALPPCHYAFQFYVAEGKLSCLMNMRSVDLFLGGPFDISSYALLTHMVAQVCDLDVGELILTLGDAHIYKNHFDQVREQLQRTPDTLPNLWINPEVKDIDSFTMDDIRLENYNPQATISAPMAV